MAIRSFRCKKTCLLFSEHRTRVFKAIERPAFKKLLMLDQAETLDDLKNPPSNHLEMLKGDRHGQYSIRINDQWRLCFQWENGDALNVEIVDYH